MTEFMEEATNGWISYRPLMLRAIEEVRKTRANEAEGRILELGAGDGSTAWLARQWKGRILTLETDQKWLDRYTHLRSDRHEIRHVHNWDEVAEIDSVVFDIALVDHAPGERRVADIRRLANTCGILVIHDTEPGQARAGYGYDSVWSLFKHIRHDDRLGTWATAVSNFVNVVEWGELP